MALAERALIDPIIYREEDEDEISDEAQVFTDNESLDELKNYNKEKGIPEGAISENIQARIDELPEGRSLLSRPETEETSLLERTG